jgi:hypothetical protein
VSQPLRLIEEQSNRLSPRHSRTPAAGLSPNQRTLDREILVFRREVNESFTNVVACLSTLYPRTDSAQRAAAVEVTRNRD